MYNRTHSSAFSVLKILSGRERVWGGHRKHTRAEAHLGLPVVDGPHFSYPQFNKKEERAVQLCTKFKKTVQSSTALQEGAQNKHP